MLAERGVWDEQNADNREVKLPWIWK